MTVIWKVTNGGRRGKRKSDYQHRGPAKGKGFKESAIHDLVTRREEKSNGWKIPLEDEAYIVSPKPADREGSDVSV